jgi:hypothetical protein
MKKASSMRALFLALFLITFQCLLTSHLRAATMTYGLSDLIGTYGVLSVEEDDRQFFRLGSAFRSLRGFSVEYWGNITSFPLIADSQGRTKAGSITGGIHFEMLPFPATGYGWGFGVALPDELGEFYRKFTFRNSSDLKIPSTEARLDIGFYFTGYQPGEYFFQKGELNLTDVKVTLEGTTVPETAAFWFLGPCLAGLIVLKKKAHSLNSRRSDYPQRQRGERLATHRGEAQRPYSRRPWVSATDTRDKAAYRREETGESPRSHLCYRTKTC